MLRFGKTIAIALPLSVVLLLAGSTRADDKVHEGKVVKAGDGKLTMTVKDDEKQQTHDVAKDAVIRLDDREAKLSDIKKGHHVKVTINDRHIVTRIEAHSHHDG